MAGESSGAVSCRLKRVGMEGPKMSTSRMPERSPRRAKARERFAAMVDLPTPPLAEEMAMMCETEGMGRLVGRPRWKRGGVPVLGRPWGEGVSVLFVQGGRGRRGIYQGVFMAEEAGCPEEAG